VRNGVFLLEMTVPFCYTMGIEIPAMYVLYRSFEPTF